jgi:hypothetical protein
MHAIITPRATQRTGQPCLKLTNHGVRDAQGWLGFVIPCNSSCSQQDSIQDSTIDPYDFLHYHHFRVWCLLFMIRVKPKHAFLSTSNEL